jgi:hypothetical protein
MAKIRTVAALAGLAGLTLAMATMPQGASFSQPAAPEMAESQDDPVPASLAGPFIADPDVVMRLDKPSTDGTCRTAGPLVFGCLIQALVAAADEESPTGPYANPFNLRVASDILATFRADLDSFRTPAGTAPTTGDSDPSIEVSQQLNPGFLTDPALGSSWSGSSTGSTGSSSTT